MTTVTNGVIQAPALAGRVPALADAVGAGTASAGPADTIADCGPG